MFGGVNLEMCPRPVNISTTQFGQKATLCDVPTICTCAVRYSRYFSVSKLILVLRSESLNIKDIVFGIGNEKWSFEVLVWDSKIVIFQLIEGFT